MCLLSVGLEALGFLLRVWLWISVPMAVIILLVATYFNYFRQDRERGVLQLAAEGWSGGMGSIGEEEEPEMWMTERPAAGSVEEAAGSRADEEPLGDTGKETIYRGILWMKQKYEQYREQADRRYEQLREEFGRSEHRYQELLAAMEQSKNTALGAGPGPGPADGGERSELTGGGLEDQLADVRGQLGVKAVIIDELEGQLRLERLKVEELVVKLQVNSDLLLKIYRELESDPNLGKETGRISP